MTQTAEANIWLTELDKEINKKCDYEKLKEKSIAEKKILLLGSLCDSMLFSLHRELYSEYKKYIADSALYYIELNLDLSERACNKQWLIRSQIDLLHQYTSLGNYGECIALLNKLGGEEIPEEMLYDYYRNCEFLYSELADNARSESNKNYYNQLQEHFFNQLAILENRDPERIIKLKEWQLMHQGHSREALQLNDKRCEMITIEHPEYSSVYFDRAMIERNLGNTHKMKFNLALSAINDIRKATKDNASLLVLAKALHEEGDLDRAFRYAKIASDDAMFFNAIKRNINVSRVLPDIENSLRMKLKSQQLLLFVLLVIISLLSGLAIINIFFLRKQKKHLKIAHENLATINQQQIIANSNLEQANKDLQLANHIKEEYLANFLSLYSFYIDKIDTFRKEVFKSLTHGKNEELIKRCKSNEMNEADIDEFYHNFDKSILAIFPNFVEEFNNLLQPEYKIELRKNELLNIELRIFALIRLGITDSTRIAKLLRYSVNTIYNYRARIKNRSSVPREEFESYISKI